MSAYRQAMLSVPPERLEQFSMEIKQDISESKKKSRKSSRSRDGHHKSKKQSRSSGKTSKQKSDNSKKTSSEAKSSNRKRRKDKESKRTSRDKRSRRDNSDEEERLTGDSDVEEGGLDLDKELQPLSCFVKERKLLMEQVFKIVKGPKLSAMLPDILKDIAVDELKRKCLFHLEVMSSKRIVHILAGQVMESSSGTDSTDNEAESNEAAAKVTPSRRSGQKRDTPSLQTNFIDSTTPSSFEVLSLLAEGSQKSGPAPPHDAAIRSSDSKSDEESSAHEEGEVLSDDEAVEVEVEEVDLAQACQSSDLSNDEEEVETIEVVEDAEYEEMVDTILEETLPSQEKPTTGTESQEEEHEKNTSNLTQLELLELQLRERAIKSLMKAAGKIAGKETT